MKLLLECILETAKTLNLSIDRSNAAILSGALHTYSTLTLEQTSDLTEISLNEIIQLIDKLVQNSYLVREGVSSFYLQQYPLELKSILTVDALSANELTILGWMKGFRGIHFEDIEFFTKLSRTVCLRSLLALIGQGFLKGSFQSKKHFNITSMSETAPIPFSKVPTLSQALVGMLLCWKKRLKTDKMAEILQISDSQIIFRILYLIATGVIDGHLSIVSRRSVSKKIVFQLTSVNYEREKYNIAHFSGFFAQIMGSLLLYRRRTIFDLASDFEISEEDLLRGFFIIIAQQDVPLRLDLKKPFQGTLSLEIPYYPPQIKITDLDLLEFFLVTQLTMKERETRQIPLIQLGMEYRPILELLGKLTLKGVLHGYLKKDTLFLSDSLTFLPEDRTLLQTTAIRGYFLSTSAPTLPDLCKKLQLLPEKIKSLIEATNKEDSAFIEIKDSQLIPHRLTSQSLPILGVPQDLLIILGFLNCVRMIDLREAPVLLQLSPERILFNIFALVGAGYVKILISDDKIRVTERRKLVPQLESLSERNVELMDLLVFDSIKLDDLSKSLGQSHVLVRWQICVLVALGFLECQMLLSEVIIKNRPISQNGAPYKVKCYGCSFPLTSDSSWCPKCGLSKQLCVVCQGIIEFGVQVGSCPFCDAIGHLEHLQEYLKINQVCAVCGQQYTSNELRFLKSPSPIFSLFSRDSTTGKS
ncbi:MAG: hypothetical protein ACFFCQ_08180 [Promethearchaeota archaeon]